MASGFVSRDNPDESARNSFLLYQEAGIPRSETVLWNIVPWYIGTGTRVRPANAADIREGLRYLGRLLNLLPRLEVIVMVGQKAQKAQRHIDLMRPEVAVFRSPHPSPLFIDNKPENRGVILTVLQEVAAELRLASARA